MLGEDNAISVMVSPSHIILLSILHFLNILPLLITHECINFILNYSRQKIMFRHIQESKLKYLTSRVIVVL